MSASDKKKLRKEQNAAAMTEKQQQAKKEAKKLKAYTISFVVVMVLVVAIVLGATLKTPINGMIDRSTTAVTVGNRELSSTEFSYFYVDAITSFYNTYYSAYSSYGSSYVDLLIQMYTGFSPSTAVGDQTFDATTGTTWADYFIEEAKENAKWTYAIYDEAMKNNFTLDEDNQAFLDSFEDNMNLYATLYGYSNVGSYLRSSYGDGANLKTYKAYYEVSLIASSYAEEYYDSLEYTDSDYRDYEKDKYSEFSSFSFAHHYIDVDNYLTGGTPETDEDGKTTTVYNDTEKAAAVEAAKQVAELLANADNNTVEKLNAAIAALESSQDDETADDETETAEAEVHENYLYSNLESHVTEAVLKWLTDSSRADGEISYIADTTKNDDGSETINGYYVVLFVGSNDNIYHTADVRHILVKFEGGTEDEDGNTVYSDEEKAAALAEAEALLQEWKNGDATVDTFADLAKNKSEDTGTKEDGGLIEDINLGSGYVESFTEWALAEHEVGDTGIIESVYGYHIMYYVSSSELTYRDTMINDALADADYDAWESALTSPVTVTDGNLNRLDRDIVVSQ